jgi:hypothetical protein
MQDSKILKLAYLYLLCEYDNFAIYSLISYLIHSFQHISLYDICLLCKNLKNERKMEGKDKFILVFN